MKFIIGNITTKAVVGGNDYLLKFDIHKKLKTLLRVRKKGYDRTGAYREKRWDGYTKLMTSNGVFATGFLPVVIQYLKKLGVTQIELVDERINKVKQKKDFVFEIGNAEGWVLGKAENESVERGYQLEGVQSVFKSNIEGLPFWRGIAEGATNYGKNTLMAGVINNIVSPKMLIFCDRENFFTGTKNFMREIYGDNVGIVQGKHCELEKDIVMVMVKSLANKLDSINVRTELLKYNGLILDECHRAGSPVMIKCTSAVEAYVRLFMSGTPFDIDDKYKKLMQVGQSGKRIFKVSNMDLINKGVSLEPICTVHLSKTGHRKSFFNYAQEYSSIVSNSPHRARIILQIIKQERKLTLVVVKHKKHGDFLYDYLSDNLPGNYDLVWSHGQDKERDYKRHKLVEGKVDVFITTSILQEGDVGDYIQRVIYAAGGKDKVSVKQFYGRSARNDGVSDNVEFHDFWDIGHYVSKHSRKRIKFLKKEGFKVMLNYHHNSQYTPVKIH